MSYSLLSEIWFVGGVTANKNMGTFQYIRMSVG